MKLVIDLDQHEAIQDFSIGAPANSFEFKSQDTIDWQIYFVKGGIPQDLGAGMAIKMGMIKTGDTTDTILAYQTTFTYVTDPVTGYVYYKCQVNYNTSQMASAITGQTQLPCTTELRYQSSDGEIVHTLNIACLVFPTILVETGVTPPGVSTGYPDASTIELLVHKNVASGYAGLDTNSHISGSTIPVDAQTINLNSNNQIQNARVITTTSASFVTPASGANVSITVVSGANLKANQYVYIVGAGYYIVESISTNTVVIQNNGDPINVASGITVPTGACLLPAQAASGGGGSQGQSAFTTTTAPFTVPAAGSTVSVAMNNTGWMGGIGYWVYITGAGYYVVNSLTDVNHAVLTNGGSASNQPPGTVIATNAQVSPAGPAGAAGQQGSTAAAYDALTASFVMPNANASVTISISNTAWVGSGQIIYIAGGGYFSVSQVSSATQLLVTNANYPGNAAPGATVPNGAHVSAAGLQGPAGAGGSGRDSFATLSADFTQPAANGTVTITVSTTAWIGTNQIVYVVGGGYYRVQSVSDLTHVILVNLGYAGNASSGSNVSSSGGPLVSPGGVQGPSGATPITTTTANFTVPANNASVVVPVVSSAGLVNGQSAYVQQTGYFTVANTPDQTHVTLTNSQNVSAGTVVTTGAQIAAIQVVGSGGSGGGGTTTNYRDPDVGMEIREMFFAPYAFPGGQGALTLQNNWSIRGSGSINCGANTIAGLLPSSSLLLGTAGSATICYLSLGYFGNTYETDIPIGQGIATFKMKMAVDSLITAPDAKKYRTGLIKYNGTDGTLAGLYFEYDYNNSANWVAVASTGIGTGANRTQLVSTVVVAANTWVKFKIVTDATWQNISYYINGALVGTITTTLPSVGTDIGVQLMPIQMIRTAFSSVKNAVLADCFFQYAAPE